MHRREPERAHYGPVFVAVGVGWPGVALLHLATHAVFETLLFLAPVAALLWIGDSMR